MRLEHVFGAAAICTLYLGAASHPVNDLKTLDSRARFPDEEPHAPVPKPGDPIPGAGPGTHTGASNWGQALAFQPPASFTKDIGGGKGSYLTTGQGVEADLKAAKDSDAISSAAKDYAANIKNYKVADSDTKVVLELDYLKELEAPFKDLGIDGNTKFREALIDAGANDPIHEGYYSADQKTAIISDVDNSRYGPDFTGNKVYQSQILFAEWSNEAGKAGKDVSSLQWVAQADIANKDTQGIINDAQIATKGSVQTDTQVTFSATAADGSAEKASFDALAGSDNGRMVFKMLTDNHKDMGGKTVVAAHTWVLAKDRPAPWFAMVWELSV